jgi:hypothetical protein
VTFTDLLPSFDRECALITADFMKTAYAVAPAKKPSHAEKVERHLISANKDWRQFEKDMKGKRFRQAVLTHPMSDDKLKAYVKAMGEYQTSKKVVGHVPSRSTANLYAIKELPGGRLACGCKDWRYKHSHQGTDCAHIQELAQGLKEKLSEVKRKYPSACKYCSKPPAKGVLWADGRAIIYVCDDHLEKARHQVEVTNHDSVAAIRRVPQKEKAAGTLSSLARGVALAGMVRKAEKDSEKGKTMKENVGRLRRGAALVPVHH